MGLRNICTLCTGTVEASHGTKGWQQMYSLGMRIVLLGETWEKDTCTIPQISGYIVHLAMQNKRGHRGQGGFACIYHTHLRLRIFVAKIDTHH